MDYSATILASPASVPPCPAPSAVKFAGISIVSYVLHRLEHGVFPDFAGFRVDQDARFYSDKVHRSAGFVYSAPIAAGRLLGDIGNIGEVAEISEVALRSNLICLGSEYAVSAMPIVFATADADVSGVVRLQNPIDTQQALNLVATMTNENTSTQLAAAAEAALVDVGILDRDSLRYSRFIQDRLGVMLWSFNGTDGRDPSAPFGGAAEAAAYSWELAALLSYTVDHMREPGLWRRQSSEQIHAVLRTGFSFLDDHIVFANATCCLEVAHLPGWFRGRSRARLEAYGFDSSSLFVFGVSVLRGAALRDLFSRYKEELAELSNISELSAAEHTQRVARRLEDESYAYRLAEFRDQLREARNRVFADYVDDQQRTSRLVEAVARELDRVGRVSDGLLQVGIERRRNQLTTRLAAVGVVLTAVGVPEMVSNIEGWVRGGDWIALAISAVVMLAVLVGVPVLLARRR